jgi:DNA-binding NtrC family response regulator
MRSEDEARPDPVALIGKPRRARRDAAWPRSGSGGASQSRSQPVNLDDEKMTERKKRVLIADDQQDVVEALRLLLKGESFDTETAASPAGVLESVESSDFDIVLMDLNYTRDTTSGREGLDLLSRLQELDSTLPVIVMTAWGSIQGAVEAMRRGARDYVEKPWDNQRLVSLLRTHVELGRALRESARLESENQLLRRRGLPELIAESPAMKPVLTM